MNSRPPDDLISAYADGETSPEETRAAEALLSSSAEARQELDDFRALSSLLKGLPGKAVPGDFAQAVLRQAERESLLGAAADPAPPRAAGRRTFWISAVSFVGTAAAVLGVMFLLQTQPPRDGSPEAVRSLPPDDDGGLVADATPVHVGRESGFAPPASRSMAAESTADAPMSAIMPPGSATARLDAIDEPRNPLRYRDYNGLRSAEVGDVVEAMKSIGPDEVVVVQLTVLDRVEGRNSLQLLLQRNDIALEPPSAPPEATANGNYSFFVESDVDQISSVFAELQRERQVAEIEVANSVPVLMLNDDFADNGYSTVPSPPALGVASNGYSGNYSINRAIARKQSLELQQESLQNKFSELGEKSSPLRTNSGPFSGETDRPPAESRAVTNAGKPAGANENKSGSKDAQVADKKNQATTSPNQPVVGNRSRVLRVDDVRQQEIVDSAYGNYRLESDTPRYAVPARKAEIARPDPPPLPEPSDKELRELWQKEMQQAQRRSSAEPTADERKPDVRSVQVLFVLVPQEVAPAAPASDAKPADPDGAS